MDSRRALADVVSHVVRKITPKLYYRIREREIASRERERDTASFLQKSAQRRLMRRLCDRARTSLDVGAHRGDYTMEMVSASRRVVAFEPIPELVAKLRDLARGAPGEMLVEPVALSNASGTAVLRIPHGKPGSSTLETENLHVAKLAASERVEEISVPLRRLDEYGYDDVQIVKIDVEGHQLAMLEGAAETFARCMPHVLIEIDNAHAADALDTVDAKLRAMGYEGFFLISTVLFPMRAFDRDRYHSLDNWRSGRLRINDFFYFHADRLAELERECSDYTWQRA